MKIVVVGGSAAGPKTAARARRMAQHAEITVVQEGPDLSMASCGYPYCVGGFFNDRNALLSTPTGVVRDPEFHLNAKGIDALTRTRVTAIHADRRVLTCRDLDAEHDFELAYDKLVLATGARPVIPPVPGVDLDGVKLRNGIELPCELAVVPVGVRPNAQLAQTAGLALGPRGRLQRGHGDHGRAGQAPLHGRQAVAPENGRRRRLRPASWSAGHGTR